METGGTRCPTPTAPPTRLKWVVELRRVFRRHAGQRMRARMFALVGLLAIAAQAAEVPSSEIKVTPLPKVRVAADGRGLETASGKPFVPFGLTYYRPGTGWAPQVWKQFDAEATRRDFARMKELGVNCVRVFLSFGSF